MKTVKYVLTGKSNRLVMMLTDVLGAEYEINREGYIDMYHYPNIHYHIVDLDFEEAKHILLKGSVSVNPNLHVRPARVELIRVDKIDVVETTERDYRFFKPKLNFTDNLKCTEV